MYAKDKWEAVTRIDIGTNRNTRNYPTEIPSNNIEYFPSMLTQTLTKKKYKPFLSKTTRAVQIAIKKPNIDTFL